MKKKDTYQRIRRHVVDDSMAPSLLPGMLVEFEIVDPIRSRLKRGGIYLLWRKNGLPLLQCLISIGRTSLKFAAINQDKYPGSTIVKRKDITCIGIAVARLEPPPPPMHFVIPVKPLIQWLQRKLRARKKFVSHKELVAAAGKIGRWEPLPTTKRGRKAVKP